MQDCPSQFKLEATVFIACWGRNKKPSRSLVFINFLRVCFCPHFKGIPWIVLFKSKQYLKKYIEIRCPLAPQHWCIFFKKVWQQKKVLKEKEEEVVQYSRGYFFYCCLHTTVCISLYCVTWKTLYQACSWISSFAKKTNLHRQYSIHNTYLFLFNFLFQAKTKMYFVGIASISPDLILCRTTFYRIHSWSFYWFNFYLYQLLDTESFAYFFLFLFFCITAEAHSGWMACSGENILSNSSTNL